VPLAAGGGLDFVARAVGDFLSRSLGQQVFIENRTGGGSTIGIDAAIKSTPDGYTALVVNDNISSAPFVMRNNANYLNDLIPVGLLSRQPQALGVHPSLGVTTVAELVALIKKNGSMGYATSGVGSNQHFLGEAFAKVTGVKLEHVPYRGAGQAINDLLAGHVKIGFLGPTAMIPHQQSGGLRMIAQSALKRAETLPEIPTFLEAGYKDLDLESWYGVYVPLGTPPAIVSRLNGELNRAMADPAIRANLAKSAQEAVGGTPGDLDRLARDYSQRYEQLSRELNIRVN
jgi:tripartite-type tricarboxylate transporter receptor subunit TctC